MMDKLFADTIRIKIHNEAKKIVNIFDYQTYF